MRNRIIVGVVIAIVLVGFLVFVLTRSSSPSTPAPKPQHPATAQTQNKPSASSAPKTSGQSSGSAAQNGGGSSALTDTGPGDVAAVFVVAGLSGYAWRLRRLARN